MSLSVVVPKKRKTIWISILLILSLSLSEYLLRHHPEFSFYMLPTRFWEFCLGGMLALNQHKIPYFQRKSLVNLAYCSGIVLLLAPVFIYSNLTAFPGISALAPTFGTVILIAFGAHPGNVMVKAVRSKIPVFIGKISYSLYLWHWVLLSFLRHYYEEVELSSISLIIVGIIVFPLSGLT
jgi:peptidoglycan/LPS O-acetylase OafA/YrhL